MGEAGPEQMEPRVARALGHLAAMRLGDLLEILLNLLEPLRRGEPFRHLLLLSPLLLPGLPAGLQLAPRRAPGCDVDLVLERIEGVALKAPACHPDLLPILLVDRPRNAEHPGHVTTRPVRA